MRHVRKRRSAAALAIYIWLCIKRSVQTSFVLDQTMADEKGPGIDTNPGPRNAVRRQKGLRELSRAVAVRRIPSFPARC